MRVFNIFNINVNNFNSITCLFRAYLFSLGFQFIFYSRCVKLRAWGAEPAARMTLQSVKIAEEVIDLGIFPVFCKRKHCAAAR